MKFPKTISLESYLRLSAAAALYLVAYNWLVDLSAAPAWMQIGCILLALLSASVLFHLLVIAALLTFK